MFSQILLLVYRLFLDGGRRKINWIEQRLGFDGNIALSLDDKRNEPSAYESIFSQEHRPNVEQLYRELLGEMKGVPYQQCDDILDALVFLQEISAIALWKYHQSLGAAMEAFVRDFDRLDVPDERIRLYESVQGY